MPVATQRPRVLLDWFTVSYRSVVAASILSVAALVAGVWFLFFHASGKPRRQAGEAIAHAQERLVEAEALPANERLDEARGSARAALAEGKDALARRQYDDARIAAIRSENFAQKAIDLSRGESAADRGVRISRIEGEVRVKRAGEFNWESADQKMTLKAGDQVKTAASGSVQLIYFDGTLTTINPSSLLEIRELHEDPATKVRRVRESLNWGDVQASTQKTNVDGSFHEVATPSLAARAEDAGEIHVTSDKDSKASSVDVFSGRVDISANGRKERLESGERISAAKTGELQPKETLPDVPRPIAPADQKVLVYEDPAKVSTTLTWEKAANAASYHLVISDHLLFTTLLYDADRAETAVPIPGVQPGDYYWKVAAVSPAGIRGPYSPTRRFRVATQALRDKGDTTPPDLTITEKVQSGPMLILNGKTEPGALLWVDNEKVEVTDDGSFYAVIRLRKEGVNEVLLQAQDAAGNVRKLTDKAYVDPF